MEYIVKVEGVMETANGRSRVRPGQAVQMTEAERAANAALFVEPPPVWIAADSTVYAIQPDGPVPLTSVMKPVRHTPKLASPVRKPSKR